MDQKSQYRQKRQYGIYLFQFHDASPGQAGQRGSFTAIPANFLLYQCLHPSRQGSNLCPEQFLSAVVFVAQSIDAFGKPLKVFVGSAAIVIDDLQQTLAGFQ